jgi:hypothetical protein
MHVRSKVLGYLTKAEALEMICDCDAKSLEDVGGHCGDILPVDAAQRLKKKLLAARLTEFEAIQLIDNAPKNLLCLQLVIEEMEERFSEGELKGILSLFQDR